MLLVSDKEVGRVAVSAADDVDVLFVADTGTHERYKIILYKHKKIHTHTFSHVPNHQSTHLHSLT